MSVAPITWNDPATAASALAPYLDATGGCWVLIRIDPWNCMAGGNNSMTQYRTARFAPGVNGAIDLWADAQNWHDGWPRNLNGAVTGWALIA
jgi:hypothetical protein